MKLREALQLVNKPPTGEPLSCFLACGITPLHLQQFLQAHLIEQTQRPVRTEIGLFGDLPGNVARLGELKCDVAAVVLEWSDLDPRLGHRGVHGFRPGKTEDVLHSVTGRLHELRRGIAAAATAGTIVAVTLPTLPLPSLFPGPPPRAGEAKMQLLELAFAWAAKLAEHPFVRVVDPQEIDRISPLAERYAARADLTSGFPYQLPHASHMGELLSKSLFPPAPLKGLITDLDDTLWRGILGEQGLEGVSWDLDHQSHGHAIYQATLAALADTGTLVAVASKNDPDLVAQAFRELDLVVEREQLFPIEAHWQRKSESVQRILRAWNIAADSVMFVDDSPAELAEVQAAFPSIETQLFPTGDEASIVRLTEFLRCRFGKYQATAEDGLRAASLKANEQFEAATAQDPDDFLAAADAELTFTVDRPDSRSYELINKTNQFNLNGIRIAESSWRSWASDPCRFLIAVDYVDKFGPLGKIAVIAGKRQPDGPPTIDTWVMSCRSFSRRIEFQTLKFILAHLETTEISLQFKVTERNGPMRDFLTSLIDAPPHDSTLLRQADFEKRGPNVYGKVTVQ